MQVGVHARTLGAFVPLRRFVRPPPIAIGIPPQTDERRGELRRWFGCGVCLHVRHVRVMAQSIDEAADYPFAPLFKGALGALLVTYTIVLLLSIFFNVELIRRLDWGVIRAP